MCDEAVTMSGSCGARFARKRLMPGWVKFCLPTYVSVNVSASSRGSVAR